MKILNVSAFLIVSFFIINFGPSFVSANTAVFQQGVAGYGGVMDGYITTGYQNAYLNSNYGNQTNLLIQDSYNYTDLIKFDLSSVGTVATVSSATLSLYDYNDNLSVGYNPTLTMYKILKPWKQSSVTCAKYDGINSWSNFCATGSGTDYDSSKISSKQIINDTTGWYVFDIDPLVVQDWINNPTNNNGLKIVASGSGGNGVSFYSSEYLGDISLRPKLTINYTGGNPVPGQPGNPTPIPPTISMSASPNSVISGQSSVITWSSSNATSCVASGNWSGSKNTSGSQSTEVLILDSTFILTCVGSGGSITKSVTVSVLNPTTSIPVSNGLKIDLSYVNKNLAAFNSLKSMVDDAIAGKPDYGFIPQHAALMYKITGEAKYCNFAISYVESCPNGYEQIYGIRCGVQKAEEDIAAGKSPYVASDSYLKVGPIIGSLAMTYDWCGSMLTSSQKTRWENYANQAIYNVWHPKTATWGGKSFSWSGWSTNNPGNNYYYSFLEATMSWALATHDSTLLSFLRNEKLQPLVNYFAQLPGGGSLEGTGYGASHMTLFYLYQLWKDSTGEDLANMNGHLSDSIKYWVHATTPNRAYYAPIGDLSRASFPDLFDYHRILMLEAHHLTNNTTTKDLSSWWLNNVSVNKVSKRLYSQWDLIPSGTPVSSIPNEPLTYRATGVGRIFTRTGWDTSALWLTFVAGKYNENHAHQDQGAFTLANKNWLTVSNNIFSHSGINQSSDYQNVVRFSQNGVIVPQKRGTESLMTVNQIGSNGEIDVTANLTPAYGVNSAIQNWTRNIKFAQRKLLVTDNFSKSSNTEATFQIHVPVQPIINGNLITAGELNIKVISPTNPVINVVNLERYRIDISGGVTGYVVELSDSASSSTSTPPVIPQPTVDTTPPIISSVLTSSISTSSTVISWVTNESSNSQVEYGLTSSYGLSSVIDQTSSVLHNKKITGLLPNTLYHYRVKSKDVSGNLAVSGDYTFTTLSSTNQSTTTPSGTELTNQNLPQSYGGSTFVPISSPTLNQTINPIETTQVVSSNYSPLFITKSLYLGTKDEEVVKLQTFLIKKGFLPSSTSPLGYYGIKTREAVKKFQCQNNIICYGNEATTGYGVVGKTTRGVILQQSSIYTSDDNLSSTTEAETIKQLTAIIESLTKQIAELIAKKAKGL